VGWWHSSLLMAKLNSDTLTPIGDTGTPVACAFSSGITLPRHPLNA
jgi:hypothetical protein